MRLASLVVACLSPLVVIGQSNLRRCYTCRSRGELGDCRDPFSPPEAGDPGVTALTQEQLISGIDTIPCSSGWCSKILDGDKNALDNFGVAHERSCMQRGPSDNKERCVYLTRNHKEVFMCMCKGDLCNSSPHLRSSPLSVLLIPLLSTILALYHRL
eukprot:TRINITY_DN20557_c0_g1_i1.p1 TRINITY_DN20557_c0_g1~~TRINITY_DN20557_c0_g1_i1.p1  ORF type:complete len:157 (-),score=10.11 TRINITY_DN20557_c0_g1_i1:131-601(-)